MKRHQRMLAAASLGLLMGMACQTQAADRDLDNDGRWDFNRGGADRDMDNDGRQDAAWSKPGRFHCTCLTAGLTTTAAADVPRWPAD